MKNTTIPSDKKERNNWGATEEDEILLKRSRAEFAEVVRDLRDNLIDAMQDDPSEAEIYRDSLRELEKAVMMARPDKEAAIANAETILTEAYAKQYPVLSPEVHPAGHYS